MKAANLYHAMSPAVQQDDLFTRAAQRDDIGVHAADKDMTPAEQFAYWKTLPGSRQILRAVYRQAYRYGRRFERTGQRVSVRLIWHLVRDHVQGVKARCRRQGIELKKWKGYNLNNTLSPYVADHIEARRPEWKGMFEKRERKAS